MPSREARKGTAHAAAPLDLTDLRRLLALRIRQEVLPKLVCELLTDMNPDSREDRRLLGESLSWLEKAVLGKLAQAATDNDFLRLLANINDSGMLASMLLADYVDRRLERCQQSLGWAYARLHGTGRNPWAKAYLSAGSAQEITDRLRKSAA